MIKYCYPTFWVITGYQHHLLVCDKSQLRQTIRPPDKYRLTVWKAHFIVWWRTITQLCRAMVNGDTASFNQFFHRTA